MESNDLSPIITEHAILRFRERSGLRGIKKLGNATVRKSIEEGNVYTHMAVFTSIP